MRLTGILLVLAVLAAFFAPASRSGAAAPLPPSPAGAIAASAAERFVIVPAESQVIYRVGETFINENNRFNVAVGITQVIRGEVLIDRANPQNSRVGTISVDISQLRSDRARRDQAIRERWLESARYPIAEFSPTGVRKLPSAYTDGREISLEVVGNLKVREAVRPTTFTVTLKLERNTLIGLAATTVLMTDFGFEPPSIFGILRAQNEVKLEFRFVARKESP